MENAELVGVSRQIALRQNLNIVANNLANLNTSGYKAQSLLFAEYLNPVARANAFALTDRRVAFVTDDLSRNNLSQGGIVQTDSPLDVAINGPGWFVVETAAGERYSRAGRFQISPGGDLVTASGDPVLGVGGGPITFTPEETDIVIAADGTVSTSTGPRGQLQIVALEGPNSITPEGGNLFAVKEGIVPAPIAVPRLVQGAYESSNVQSIAEVTRMIEVTRAYESVTRMIQRQDELRIEAINQLGRLEA